MRKTDNGQKRIGTSRLILIEFNELCPSLLEKWMKAGYLPNFSRFYSESEVYVTEADELQPPNLEPWIQWYSLHTGLPYSEHGVFHLTDGPKAKHPDVWSLLHQHGLSVWNCSSMNARRVDGAGAIYLPDPWCDATEPYPSELAPFYKVVSEQVREYSNSERKLTYADYARFLRFLAAHGLTIKTIGAISRQLLSELWDSGKTWKRVALLDKLLFDVFSDYFSKARPDFSTYFVNSTAHLQHSYWRHMVPDAFSVRPDEIEIRRFKDAILFGYRQMDALLGRFLRLAGRDTTLMFATALSQQPYLKYEAIGGHRFFRPRSVKDLLAHIGLHPERIDAVMTHQFIARFRTKTEADEARVRLAEVRSSVGDVFGFDHSEPDSVYFGCQLRTLLKPDTKIDFGGGEFRWNFFDWFYQIEGTKSGRHHPDGCLWLRRGVHSVCREKVSILDILPTILDFFGLSVTGYSGQSLLDCGSKANPPPRQRRVTAPQKGDVPVESLNAGG